jgi:hypothetical protein
MPSRPHSADLRGRRQDLGIGVRDMAAGLGIELGRLLSMEDGTATEEDKTFYRTWLSRIEGWSDGERHLQSRAASIGRRFRPSPSGRALGIACSDGRRETLAELARPAGVLAAASPV